MLLQVFKNLFKQKADSSQVEHQDGYIKYGSLDNFPLKLAKLIEDSPSGSACLSTLSDFIEGNGFSSADISKIIINKKRQTLGWLHSMVSDSFANNEGFYINVKYSGVGKKTEFYFLPFENCRLEMPDEGGDIQHIYYNAFFGDSMYKKQQTKIYRTYNPDPAVVQSQIKTDGKKFLGQVFFYGTNKALHRFYPEPQFYSAADWFEVDAGIGEYWKNILKKGFLQSLIFKVIGDPLLPSTDPAHQTTDTTTGETKSTMTIGEAWSELMAEKFGGSEKSADTMTFWANVKEEFPEIQAVPTDVKAEIFKVVNEQTTKNITIATKVPAILANIQEGVSLGGDGKTIQAAVKLMQQRVVKKHHLLETTYTDLLTNSTMQPSEVISIVHYDPYPEDVTVDPLIWTEMTSEERRNWIKKNTDIELIATATPPAVPAQPPLNGPTGVLYNNYPDGAKANAARALKFKESGSMRCGSKMGWDLAARIAEGGAVSYKEIKRMRNFLTKHEQFKNDPFERCEPVMYHMWGGKAMQDWVEGKVKEQEE